MRIYSIVLKLTKQPKKKDMKQIETSNNPRANKVASYSKAKDVKKNTLLSISKMNPCRNRVIALLEENSSAAFATDSYGKLPLHLACEYGASPAVIRELLHANPKAARERDILGMLPIHRICSSYYTHAKRKLRKNTAKQNMLEVLQILLCAEPESICVEDNDNTCPIEHALNSGIDIYIIKKLQREKGIVLKQISEGSITCWN